MILVDINTLPQGVDLNIWYDLYKNGLVIYDSLLGGIQPMNVDNQAIAFIDINSLTDDDIQKIGVEVDKIHAKYSNDQDNQNIIIKENNRKLVEYLQNINSNLNIKPNGNQT